MTYEIYNYIFYGGLILAGIMLAVSVLLFFVLKIPAVIGDLSGRTAKKAIENIRNQNRNSGDKTYKSSLVNRQRGKLTEKISPSGSLIPAGTSGAGGAMQTEKISGTSETTVLDMADGSETTVLSYEMENSVFAVEYEITFIHTNEVIQPE